MRQNGRGPRLWLRFLLVSLGIAVFINEVLIYKIQSYRWPTFPDIDRDSRKYQVLLLIGDPQIQGYQDEPPFPIGSLARWDIDRYLWKTFSHAYHYSDPDLIVFLGDLMDEGSKATRYEYEQTLDRFKAIFSPVQFKKTIYIPGDNDVGGEGRDFPAKWKTDRFQKNFANITQLHSFGFVDYITLDLITHSLSQSKIDVAESIKHKLYGKYTVLLNHNTLLMGAKHFVYPITKRLRPKLVLSAHHHQAMAYTCDDCLQNNDYSWSVTFQDLTYIDSYVTFDLSGEESMIELALPTCSYRMGKADMGYGVAIIGDDGSLRFTVLWLPRRYTMLTGYLLTIVVVMVILYIWHFSNRRR